LYSKFCEATSGLMRLLQPFPSSAQISPQAPPMYGARSKADFSSSQSIRNFRVTQNFNGILPFHKWYKLVPLGRVPTSNRMHTLGFKRGANALKNHLWEFSFFAFFSLRQKTIWIGTLPLSEPNILPVSLSTMTCEVYSYMCAVTARPTTSVFAIPSCFVNDVRFVKQ
jgi:hypothetical protein